MGAKRIWRRQSLTACVLWNALLVAMLYGLVRYLAKEVPLGPAAIALGAVITFFLWLSVYKLGQGFAARMMKEAPKMPAPVKKPAGEEKPAPEPSPPSPQAAVQILAILQREGRLIDFLEEDLGPYEDVQIGAAVRQIQQDCRKALAEHLELQPIFSEGEGTEVTIPPGFDPRAIRLTGQVAGDPPFKGILRHRGWRVQRVELPQTMTEQKWILAPAEVEVHPPA